MEEIQQRRVAAFERKQGLCAGYGQLLRHLSRRAARQGAVRPNTGKYSRAVRPVGIEFAARAGIGMVDQALPQV